jgi:Ca-activated chloride channel family protein
MPTPRFVLLILFCLLALAMRPQTAAAEDSRGALFVIDGSGSMWGRFETPEEKRAKIDVVRELVRPFIANNTAARIGLQSFGHRRKRDCSDVEIIAQPSLERPNLLAALDKLNPRGKGPLAETLRQAAQGIGPDRPASIIVINDGVDNCRQDACAAAADFAKAAPDVPVHVIALGIAAAEHPALQCIPAATGGKFFDARDPVSLAAAISEAAVLALGQDAGAAQSAHAPAPDAAAAKPGETAQAALPQTGLLATLALTQGGKPLDLPATWRIFKSGSDEAMKTVTAAALTENLEPGAYIIAAELNGMTARDPVSITQGQSARLPLSLDAGRLKVSAAMLKGVQPLIVVRQVTGATSPSSTILLSRTAALDTVLPAATYAISAIAGDFRQEKTVKLAQGEEAAAAFEAGLGTLSLSAVLQDGGAPITGATFSVLEDDPDSPGGRRETRRSRASDPKFTLPPGTYYINVSAGFAETRELVALSAGGAIDKKIVLPAASVKLSTSIGGAQPSTDSAPVLHIERLDGAPREIARVTSGTYAGLLGAGRYRLSAILDRHGAAASTEITVEAGKPLAHVLNIEAGEVALKSAAGLAGDAFWEVRDGAGKALWHATAAQPKVLLAPGSYSVRLESRDREMEASFSVTAGESKTIELGTH